MGIEAGPDVMCERCGAQVSTVESRQYGTRIRSHSCLGRRADQRGLLPREAEQVSRARAALAEAARRDESSSAVLSADGLYRYELRRRYAITDTSGPTVLWVMLNPSTADAGVDDPTVRKVGGFSMLMGSAAVRVVVANLFAWRATYPTDLRNAIKRGADAVGPETDARLRSLAEEASLIVCAWGDHPYSTLRKYGGPERASAVLDLLVDVKRTNLDSLLCLGKSTKGAPRHPLMLPYNTPREPMVPRGGFL